MHRKTVLYMPQWFPGIIAILLATLPFSQLACQKKPTESSDLPSYENPEQTGDGWETASLSSVGMDDAPLLELLDDLERIQEANIHSLVIIKDGKLVFEEYFEGDKFNLAQWTGEVGFDRDDTHNLCSATKSFTSALMGIAIDRGLIQSVDQKIFDFFPEHADLLDTSPEKQNITIEDLLTMRSGLEWDDETYPYTDERNDLYQAFHRTDPIRYMLSKDLIETPGTFYAYRNCNTNLLGEIIHRVNGEGLDLFCTEHLFNKLGITDYEWQRLSNNVIFASGDLRLRPRDMAKFGQLFLNGGTWHGERIISQEWVDASIQKYSGFSDWWDDLDGYGYQWWLWEDIEDQDFEAYAASGWGGQWIIVSPDLNLVVVTTAGNYYTDVSMPAYRILVDYILPALDD